MGRGRAKAKQTKVARDLKYRTHETDLGALARELHGDEGESEAVVDSEELEKWSDYTGPSPRLSFLARACRTIVRHRPGLASSA